VTDRLLEWCEHSPKRRLLCLLSLSSFIASSRPLGGRDDLILHGIAVMMMMTTGFTAAGQAETSSQSDRPTDRQTDRQTRLQRCCTSRTWCGKRGRFDTQNKRRFFLPLSPFGRSHCLTTFALFCFCFSLLLSSLFSALPSFTSLPLPSSLSLSRSHPIHFTPHRPAQATK